MCRCSPLARIAENNACSLKITAVLNYFSFPSSYDVARVTDDYMDVKGEQGSNSDSIYVDIFLLYRTTF